MSFLPVVHSTECRPRRRRDSDPGTAALLAHKAEKYLHVANFYHARLTFGVPVDGPAHCRRWGFPIGGCASISLLFGINHLAVRSFENRTTPESTLNDYYIWHYEKPDKQKKLCLSGGLFPRARRKSEVLEVPTDGGGRGGYVTRWGVLGRRQRWGEWPTSATGRNTSQTVRTWVARWGSGADFFLFSPHDTHTRGCADTGRPG